LEILPLSLEILPFILDNPPQFRESLSWIIPSVQRSFPSSWIIPLSLENPPQFGDTSPQFRDPSLHLG